MAREEATRRCTAKSKGTGARCKRPPILGGTVCASHGGKAPQVQAAAELRLVEDDVRTAVGQLTPVEIANPLVELQRLAGEILAWKEAVAAYVRRLEHLRYEGRAGENVRGEILLYERALDRAATVLAMIVKLGIEERLARLDERQTTAIIAAIEDALNVAGVHDAAVRGQARTAAAARLRAV